MRPLVRALAVPASLAALAAFTLAAFSAACSPAPDHPPVQSTTTTLDAGVAVVPDAAVCNAAPIDSANLPAVGGCLLPFTRTMDGCIEWHAAGPYDYAAQAHIDCVNSRGTWSDQGCPHAPTGGFCAFPFTGAGSACPMTQWDYYYVGNRGADEVSASAAACTSQWGGMWTDF